MANLAELASRFHRKGIIEAAIVSRLNVARVYMYRLAISNYIRVCIAVNRTDCFTDQVHKMS